MTPRTEELHRAIDQFGQRYRYDMSYQTELLEAAPRSFDVFHRAQGTSGHRRVLPLEAHYVARIAMMQAEECLDCIQVNLRMAVEAGVDRGLLETLLDRPEDLPDELRDVRDHAVDVSRSSVVRDPERTARLRAAYGEEGWAELAVCLAGCRLFTTVKRSLGKSRVGTVRSEDW